MGASIPSGLLIARWAERLDITSAGSGNIGAANVARTVGIGWGLLTLIADMLKGFIPVALAHYQLGAYTETSWLAEAVIGFSALLGNQFSAYLHFKGGKGVATFLGVFLAISPLSFLFSGSLFVIVFSIWRYSSLGSIAAVISMPGWLLLFSHAPYTIIISLVMVLLIIVRHRENIHRLMHGDERRFSRRN